MLLTLILVVVNVTLVKPLRITRKSIPRWLDHVLDPTPLHQDKLLVMPACLNLFLFQEAYPCEGTQAVFTVILMFHFIVSF